jgi:hypothetical protein
VSVWAARIDIGGKETRHRNESAEGPEGLRQVLILIQQRTGNPAKRAKVRPNVGARRFKSAPLQRAVRPDRLNTFGERGPHRCPRRKIGSSRLPLERGGLELAVPRRTYSRERAPKVSALFGRLNLEESAENIARLRSVENSVGSPSRKLTVAPIARDGSPEFGFHCVTLPV